MNKLTAILASLRTLPTLLARMADLEEDNRRLRDDLAEKTDAPAALAYASIAAKWLAVPVCTFFATAAADLI